MRGRYVTFDVDPATFAVYDYAFTGAPNPLDITGGAPDRRVREQGPRPSRPPRSPARLSVELKDDGLEIARTGPGLEMKIQAKDCAQGGVFQMEPERGDGDGDRHHAHRSAPTRFYYDNPSFRAREGDVRAVQGHRR